MSLQSGATVNKGQRSNYRPGVIELKRKRKRQRKKKSGDVSISPFPFRINTVLKVMEAGAFCYALSL